MNVSFNGTFGLPLISPNRIRSIDYQDDKIKDFITKIDNDIKGEKDISVYSPDSDCYYIDILDAEKDARVLSLADKMGVFCKKVPRKAMVGYKNNVLVSTGKGGYHYKSEIQALSAAMECYNRQFYV